MEFAYSLSQSLPHIKKFQIAATVSNAGIPFLVPAGNGAGLAQATTTGADNMVGVGLDTATYVTAQQTDGTSAEREVSVIINPDAVYKARLSGGATESTALTLYDISTATTDGLDVTTGDSWTSPEYDEGVVWFYDGVNAGSARKITSTSSTAATVTVAFDRDHQVGDNALRAPFWPTQANTCTLTTNLYQVRADVAVATNTAALRCVEMKLRDQTDDGRSNSFVYLVSGNHVFGGVLS